MMRMIFCALAWMGLALAAQAQSRIDLSQAQVEDGWWGRAEVMVVLSEPVPYRAYTVDAPRRLVLEFQGADLVPGTPPNPQDSEIVTDLRAVNANPGWVRLIAPLSQPYSIDTAEMQTTGQGGSARLRIGLSRVEPEAFAKASLAPDRIGPAGPLPKLSGGGLARPKGGGLVVVVIDPGHGGRDPGAVHNGLVEKDIALNVARVLRAALEQDPKITAVLTRDEDRFVALTQRIAVAHHAQADLFLSLHADALSDGDARGATLYTLAAEASDAAAEILARRHNRADLLQGTDLEPVDDEITKLLLGLAHRETAPRAQALAREVARGMAQAGGPMNPRPLRHGDFAVLRAPDIPSVLIELGFLSDAQDRRNLADPAWQRRMAQGIAQGVMAWVDQQRAE